ncbi:MAG: hypothetical protein GY839_14510 [candidate division Zixibacteria bacterium]|nr:hypothetical protein [candidate division Zixibacteria bacterium]
MGFDKYDEYKFFAESTQFLTERRQSATQTYISVNTAIFAVLGFLIKDVGFKDGQLVLVSLALVPAGIFVCWIWHKIIKHYKALIAWRYDQLMEMENSIDGSCRMYNKEWNDHFKPIAGKETFGFSILEKWLPRIFMFLYFLYLLVILIVSAVAAGCFGG